MAESIKITGRITVPLEGRDEPRELNVRFRRWSRFRWLYWLERWWLPRWCYRTWTCDVKMTEYRVTGKDRVMGEDDEQIVEVDLMPAGEARWS